MSTDESNSACTGDKLLDRIIADKETADSWSNDLLSEFRKDFPISNLKFLLEHSDLRLVQIGSWVASELGLTARPILETVGLLLEHSDRKVCFFAIDSVQSAANESDGKILVKVLKLISNRDLAIRWKVLMFLAQIDHSMLQATLNGLEMSSADDHSLTEFRFLTSEDSEDPKNITHRLNEPDELVRMCGAVAAARFASTSLQPLKLAAKSADVTVRRFAKDFLERLVA